MKITEIILMNNWVERMVVGCWRSSLDPIWEIINWSGKFVGEFQKPMAVATMFYIHVLLSQS